MLELLIFLTTKQVVPFPISSNIISGSSSTTAKAQTQDARALVTLFARDQSQGAA